MKIAIEAQRIFRKEKHGMDYVALETIRELQKIDKQNEYFILVSPGDDICLQESANVHIVTVNWPSYPLWEQIGLPLALRKIKPDLLHCTSNTAPVYGNIPLVLTLHDIIFLEKKQGKNQSMYQRLGRFYRRIIVPQILTRCKRIITVSHFECNRISHFLHIDRQLLVAVHNGYSQHFIPIRNAQATTARYIKKHPYLFFLGNTDPKKNTARVLQAYGIYLKKSRQPLPLLIADLKEEIIDEYLNRQGLQEIKKMLYHPGYIPNTELPAVYSGASVFIYTSLRESFGIPILEAMACGTPVITSTTSAMPEITLFITAYNEEQVVNGKMKNCHELDYPKEKLHIVWVTDGSNDRTNEKLKAYPDVTLLFVPERKGKTAAMNRGMGFVTTPLVIFTDANTFINPQAVREIVKCFNHPQVGCVAGEKRVDMYSTGGAVSGGEGLYWKYESWLKKMDYQLYSAIGAAGELFAIRTPLYEEMPEDTLLDDFMLSLRIAMKQYTIAYCDTAYALESGSTDMKEEEKRKIRISAGGLQSVYRLKELLNPLRYGILSFQYVSHRVLRWSVTPVALFLLFPLNILLVVCSESHPVYFLFLLLQSAFYLGGVYGSFLSAKSVKNKLLYIPYYFLFMNINVIKGFFYLKRHAGGTWEKSRRA